MHTLIRVRSEGGGDRFSENPEIFSKNASGGGQFALVPTLSPPGFALRGGTIFQAEEGDQSGTRRLRGGLSPPPCINVWPNLILFLWHTEWYFSVKITFC